MIGQSRHDAGIVKVLLIEDDEDDYDILKHRLAEVQVVYYDVEWVTTVEAGVAALSQQTHDVYLVDYHLGARNGLEFLSEAVRLECKAPVIFLTGLGGHAMDVAAIESGATDYLPKSQLTAALLERSIRHSIQQKRAEAIVRALNTELEQRVQERTAQLETASRELQQSNDILKMLDRNQQGFIEIAAHELRTPLTIMLGYIAMMQLYPLVQSDPALAGLLTGLHTGTQRLHEVVNSMLDVRRIDSGNLKIIPEPVALPSMVNELVKRLQTEIRATRQLTLQVEPGADVPLIQLDPALIDKALRHILVNAIKYTPDQGTITLRLRPVTLPHAQPGLELSVADTGIGLAAEHHTLIFEKFYQVGAVALHSSSKLAFKGGGSGLGLAIARGIIHAHGGQLWIESPGYDETLLPGSTVYMQLPLRQAPPELPPSLPIGTHALLVVPP